MEGRLYQDVFETSGITKIMNTVVLESVGYVESVCPIILYFVCRDINVRRNWW